MAQIIDNRWIFSPQDVVAQFECRHKVRLSSALASKELVWQEPENEALELIRRLGLDHERKRLEALPQSWKVKRVGVPSHSLAAYGAAWDSTRQAMREMYDAIYQPTLFTGDFVGIPDFLILARDQDGSPILDRRGQAIYEPVDAKSARSEKRSAVLQVGSYAEILEELGAPRPNFVHLWLAGDDDWSGRAAPLIAVARRYRKGLEASPSVLGKAPQTLWDAPCEACARCRFESLCDQGRHQDRDLSLIQGIRSSTRRRLINAGYTTVDQMAAAIGESKPAGINLGTFEKLRAQAALQVEAERVGRVLYEVKDARPLTSLPARTEGDLWFDMEGDPFAYDGEGLEYMFGFWGMFEGAWAFDAFEAYDRTTERAAFEKFVDLVLRRWGAYPGMHVYHYASYEKTALEHLAQRHGTRELEVDQILKAGVFIDLYTLVRQTIRISTESLSLKKIEAVYDASHAGEQIGTAMDSVLAYERIVRLRKQGLVSEAEDILSNIRSYNHKDCQSTQELDSWIRSLISDESHQDKEPSDSFIFETEMKTDQYADLISALEDGLVDDPAQRGENEQARALLSAALQYHLREYRPAWWRLFSTIKADLVDLGHASDVFLVDRAETSDWAMPARARTQQRTLLTSNNDADPRTFFEKNGEAFLLYEPAPFGMAKPADSTRGYHKASITSIDEEALTLVERQARDGSTWTELPIAVIPGPPFNTDSIRAAIANAVKKTMPNENNGQWDFPKEAWADILLARLPRQKNAGLPSTGHYDSDVRRALERSDSSYVAVQGPPGTGKTHLGSSVVSQLAEAGWRIGVVAQSHAVVEHFLTATEKTGRGIKIGKEPQSGQKASLPWHVDKVHEWAASQEAGFVIGGTAWTFSRATVAQLNLDLLVIDEAGQFALANAIACSIGVKNVLLLGDPQQLPQVSQAAHPEAIEKSVLEHVALGHATIPSDRGYFLDLSYRLHPDLARAVSNLQYEGRLDAAPFTSQRYLEDTKPGLIPVPVAHSENTTSSAEEAEEVLSIIHRLVGLNWTDVRSEVVMPPRPLTQRDVIVVAAYNAQVRLIRRLLSDAGYSEVPVGTVDKFQGREAAIAIVSMATSSDEELPRGLEFLLSPNRINVAISRAQWASYLIYSPELLEYKPSSVEGIMRLGRFAELLSNC